MKSEIRRHQTSPFLRQIGRKIKTGRLNLRLRVDGLAFENRNEVILQESLPRPPRRERSEDAPNGPGSAARFRLHDKQASAAAGCSFAQGVFRSTWIAAKKMGRRIDIGVGNLGNGGAIDPAQQRKTALAIDSGDARNGINAIALHQIQRTHFGRSRSRGSSARDGYCLSANSFEPDCT